MTLHDRDIDQDVEELESTLWSAIRNHESPEVLSAIEEVRTAALDHRHDRGEQDAIDRALAGNDEQVNAAVVRAFTIYFQLINLAEERARVRTVRENRSGLLADSVHAAIERLDAEDVSAETIGRILEDVRVIPTFTAHPTEARRKTIKGQLQQIAAYLEELDERRLTEAEQEEIFSRLDAVAEGLWTTKHIRNRSPEPIDEARNVHWYLANVIMEVVPEVYDEIEKRLDEAYEDPPPVPTVLEFRSWAGSDADGNPNVTTDVTTETLDRQRRLVLDSYRNSLEELESVLTQDGNRTETDAVERSLATDRERIPGIVESAIDRYPGEPLRQKTYVIKERVERVDDVKPGGYDSVDDFLADIDLLETELQENDLNTLAETHLEPLRRQGETFGFHLASLDLRDHREMHTRAIAEALSAENIAYREMDEDERVEFLTESILQDGTVIDLDAPVSAESELILDRFDALADWQSEYGVEAIDTYCISMTEEPSHVLEVLFLADQADVVDLPEYVGLDIVPLLETESALSNAREIMSVLFENDAYGAAIEARNRDQEIMLGYSDSNKENGFLPANWKLDRAQRKLHRITADHDVTLRLFHGRGGSISRGGGPMNKALLALPTETVTGEVKFTQQGEAISETYSNPAVAKRELEQMLNAQIRARYDALAAGGSDVPDEWVAAMDEMADAAQAVYRDFRATDGFVDFFEQMTPIDVIERLNLGSRPASRSDDRDIESLRAIPWVFAWTQTRAIIPGWFGLGTGIDAFVDDESDVEMLREMYDEWPFFRITLENAALSLARTELGIAGRYASTVDSALRDRFFPWIQEEYDRSSEYVLQITGRDDLVDRPWLRTMLDRRNPYADPMNHLQASLLEESELSERADRSLRLAVRGIAAGMKDTG